MTTRRDFLKHSALGAAGLTIGGLGFSSESYAGIMGANEKIRVGIVGFSDRARHSLIPAFMACADGLGFEIVAISDIWKRRREEGVAFFQEKYGKKVKAFRNNEELYDAKMCDAVIVATADFQHALHCIEAVKAGCDAYVEKPFAETMEDARAARKAVLESGKIVQIGSQRLYPFRKVRQDHDGGDVLERQPTRTLASSGFGCTMFREGYGLEALPAEPSVRRVGSAQIFGISPVLAVFFRYSRPVDVASDRYGTLVYRLQPPAQRCCQRWHLPME